MIKEITLPEIAENVDSGDVIAVLVAEGDHVEKDQSIVELETDKAGFDLPSSESGTVVEVDVRKGDTVKVGQVIMKVETDGATQTQRTEARAPRETEARPQPERPPAQREAPEAAAAQQARPGADEEQAPAQAREEPARELAPAAPSVRREARELGIDISQVHGTGPGERITEDDLKQFARERSSAAMPAPHRDGGGPLPDFGAWGTVERKPMSKVRGLTAQRMYTSWTTVPHVTNYDQADITKLEEFRHRYKQRAYDQGANLTITPIIVKVVASALRAFPDFNASVDMERKEIVYKKYVHIGVAVDTDRGLLVPVVRNAHTKSVLQLARELAELSDKARTKRIEPNELQGGNFTVTNLGSIGGGAFAPIVNYPEVAILGVGRAKQECVVEDGQVHTRMALPLSLSYDHRVIDGAQGARFMRWVVDALENPFLIGLQGEE
jgi:pyruvate dehydrogenase E2 component (dihydrolipoamide acetyltransferase)